MYEIIYTLYRKDHDCNSFVQSFIAMNNNQIDFDYTFNVFTYVLYFMI